MRFPEAFLCSELAKWLLLAAATAVLLAFVTPGLNESPYNLF